MLHCKTCKFEKEDSEFYESNKTKCKECVKAAVRKNRENNIEHYNAFDRARANREDRVEARKAYAKTDAGKAAGNRAKRNWTNKNAKKRRASHSINNAIRDGKLEKPSCCDVCGKSGRINGHHDDYDKPLEVRWLCCQCHRDWHRENGEAKNAS